MPDPHEPPTDTRTQFSADRRLALFDRLPEMIVVVDDVGTVLYANATLKQLTGHTDAAIGRNVFEFVHPDDVGYLMWSLDSRKNDEGEPGVAVQARCLNADGSWRVCEIIGLSLLDDPDVGAVVATFRDVARQSALADTPARLRSLVDKASDLLLLLDGDGTLLFANQAVTRVLDFDCDLVVGSSWDALIHPDDRVECGTRLAALRAGDTPQGQWRTRLVVNRGRGHRTFDLVAVDHFDDPVVAGIIVIARDISDLIDLEAELHRRQEELTFEATHDHLTGLLNRAAIRARVAAALEIHPARSDGTRREDEVLVLFCDLDGFKLVNDTRGHEVGDKVLHVAAQRLEATVRSGDVVGRWGGDEFVVLCLNPPDPTNTQSLIDRLRAEMRKPIDASGEPVTIDISVGVARAQPGISPDRVLRIADEAMYRAKRSR